MDALRWINRVARVARQSLSASRIAHLASAPRASPRTTAQRELRVTPDAVHERVAMVMQVLACSKASTAVPPKAAYPDTRIVGMFYSRLLTDKNIRLEADVFRGALQ